MKRKLLLPLLAVLLFASVAVLVVPKFFSEESELFDEEDEEEEEEKEASFTEARLRYEFDLLKDPRTGKIPFGIFAQEIEFAKRLPVKGQIYNPAARGNGLLEDNTYLPAGPNNIGGRTRALTYDLRFNGTTNRVIIAGCVSGGIMRSQDAGNTWTRVTPEDDTHSFISIAQDPRPGFQDTWYAGGGEAFGNTTSEVGAAYLGLGVWRSTNNGATWTKLPMNSLTEINGTPIGQGNLETFDHPFDYVHKIAINPLNGHVYIAGHRRLLRSTDNGASFQTVFGSAAAANASNGQMDVTISSTGRIFLAVNGGNPDRSLRGVWVSNTGSSNSFARIAGGQPIGTDSIPGWRGNSIGDSTRRILITLAPSNQNIGYVLYDNGLEAEGNNPRPEADFYRLEISGNTFTWINRSGNMPDFPNEDLAGSDPLTLQDGYNMVLAVKPNDPNFVLVGGTNLYRSTDGFASSNNTAWINGYSNTFSYQQYPNGHADQHSFTFNPVNPNQGICGDDGGIRFSSDLNNSNVGWSPLPNYQTLQYYYVAVDPETGRNNFAGGAQDNGCLLRDKARVMGTNAADSNNHVRLLGGDGGAVGFAKQTGNTQYVYASSQLGEIRRIRVAPSFSNTDIKPNNLTANDQGGFGEFVTNLRVDPDNTEDLYYANFNRLFRTTAASNVSANNWTELTGVAQAVNPANPTGGTDVSIRAIAFTRGTYSNTHSLFLGTTNGRVLRLDNPRNAAPSAAPVNITPSGLTGNVQDISVNPLNDNELLVVVSNYNTVSIWWTGNAKASAPTWRNAEGNLTLPSIRSCAIVINNSSGSNISEYYVGTSVGLYSIIDLATTLTNGGSPVWEREGGNTLNFAVVQSIAYRPSDNLLLLGTHGNGMYYSFVGKSNTGPNPATGEVFIQYIAPSFTNGSVNYQIGNLTTVQKIVIQIFNAKGQLMFKEERGYENGPALDFSRYAAGVYFVSIMSNDGKHKAVQKVVRQ